MDTDIIYQSLINKLLKAFGQHLKMVILFGSRAKGEARADSDHDIFLVVENLPDAPLERLKKIRTAILDVPMRINTIAKTSREMDANLTPLLLDICVDGKCLYGSEIFEPCRKKIINALNRSGLKRKHIGREWYWQFDKIPKREWELTWEGFNELPG